MPVYNVEKYLSECLDSIVNQTLKEIEIICVNDGSTDNSLAILKEYAYRDSRIKIIDKENEGLGYTRKVGLDNATGEYILFCDSDDYYSELTAFEELYNYIEKVKVDVVIFNHIENNNIAQRITNVSETYSKDVIFSYKDIDYFFGHIVNCWKKIYSKKFLDKYDDWYFPKKLYYEDIPFHYQILIRAKMSYFDRYFYTYRIRLNSMITGKYHSSRILDSLVMMRELYKILENISTNLEFLDYFYSFVFCNIQFFLNRDFEYIKDLKIVKSIIDTIKSFDTSNLFDLKNREAYFYIRAGLRMTPENYMDYLNKKNFKIKKEEIAKLKAEKQNRNTRIKTLNEQIKTKNEQLQQKNEQIKTRDLSINQKNNEIKNLRNQNNYLHNQNNIQDQAIKRLQNSWSYRIGRLFTYPLSIPLDFCRFIRDYNLLKKSNLFDSEYYLANNEDVKKAKVDPIKHYLQFGWKEGRNPSLEFNGNEYLNKRSDVRVAGVCPLVHYLKFGKDEDLSFLFEKAKILESKNKTLKSKNKKFEIENNNLKKKLNEKSIEFEQLNRKKSELDIKLSKSTKDFEKLNKKVIDLEKFKSDIEFIYNRGINKEKISFEIKQFLEFYKSGITDEKREYEIIVSLTSYPERIYEVYYTIFSLLTQTLKPNKIILYLGEDKFPNKNKDLPKNLLEFTKYGLTIKYTKDLKSYTKLIPALKEYPNSIIVTADDDIFYLQNWLEKLYDSWKNNKDCIICHRVAIAELTTDKQFVQFNDWKQPKNVLRPSLNNCLLGYCGVLYPPNSLYKDVFDEEIFKKLSSNNDDIYFWAMAVLNNTKIKLLEDSYYYPLYVNPIREKDFNSELTLFKSNGGEKNKNQIQFDNIINHYPQIMEKLLERENCIFVDISDIVRIDVGTGVQRVTKNIIKYLPKLSKRKVIFVYSKSNEFEMQFFRYCSKFSENEKIKNEDIIELIPNDVLFFPEISIKQTLGKEKYLKSLHEKGINIVYYIYDLIPIRFPDACPDSYNNIFSKYIDIVLDVSSEIICDSKATADDVQKYINEKRPDKIGHLKIDWGHLGCDFGNNSNFGKSLENSDIVFESIKSRRTFLAVSTIEPRKMYDQLIKAFEILWNKNNDINLVIVGRNGWCTENLVKQIENHVEINKRLFKFSNINDEYLNKLYNNSTCYIMASKAEGFGLGIIEASYHNLPLILRDIPIFRELVGEKAFYFSGFTGKDLANAIEEWLILYKENKHPKSDKIKYLTWEESIKKLNNKLEDII